MRTRSWSHAFAAPILAAGAAVAAVPALAQRQPPQPAAGGTSPFAGSPGSAENLPNGSNWPMPRYERPPPGAAVAVPSTTRGPMSAATVGFAVGAVVQPELPDGFALGRPDATHAEIESRPT